MGTATCAAVLAEADLELVVAVDPVAAGRPLDEVAGVRGSGLDGRRLARRSGRGRGDGGLHGRESGA